MKKYAAAIICCICFLLCGAMGVYTYFVSAKLDEAVKNNSAASSASVNADYENELAILREANQELSRQITDMSMADNDKVSQDVKSFINLYFNRNYFSDDYDYYTSLYAQAEKYCRGEAKDFFCPELVIEEPESSGNEGIRLHYSDTATAPSVYTKKQDDGSVLVLAVFEITSVTTSDTAAELVLNPENTSTRLLNAKMVYDQDWNLWVFDTVYQLATISGLSSNIE